MLIFAGLALAMFLALAGLVWLVRHLLAESENLEDAAHDARHGRRGLFDLINPFAWVKRDTSVRLFYQRDAKGRFRKVRRH